MRHSRSKHVLCITKLRQPGWTSLTEVHIHCNTRCRKDRKTRLKGVALPLSLKKRRKLSLCGFRQGPKHAAAAVGSSSLMVLMAIDDGRRAAGASYFRCVNLWLQAGHGRVSG